eukprot:809749-Lingulodinium_polyedra.AAC.1
MGRATPGSPMTAEKPNWKQLSELRKLDIPAGEAWERNTVFITWQKDVVLASTTVSVQFSGFCLRYDANSQHKIQLQEAEPSQGATRAGPSPGIIEGVQQQAVRTPTTSDP